MIGHRHMESQMARIRVTLLAAWALSGWAGASAAQEVCAGFPNGATEHLCSCPADAAAGAVWGSGPYTADSDICTAALHAGVIGREGGGVLAVLRPGLEHYAAGTANGVTTSWWGSYSASIELFAGDTDRATLVPSQAAGIAVAECGSFLDSPNGVRCYCPPQKRPEFIAVWGSGPYTADSNICWAARHAGVIGLIGGEVSAVPVAGQSGYAGSARFGIQTADWGPYDRSFDVTR